MRALAFMGGLVLAVYSVTGVAEEGRRQADREPRRLHAEDRVRQQRDSTEDERSGRRRGWGGRPGGLRQEGDGESGLLLRMLESPEFAQRLKLSEEDRQELIEAMRGIQQHIRDKQVEMRQLAIQQARLLTATELDEAAVYASVEAIGKVRTDIAKLRMEQMLLIRQRFSAEQLQQMRRFMHQQRSTP